MAFEIIDNIEVPETKATRTRARGEFAKTLDALEVGQGFVFNSDKPLKAHYPKVSPSKFPNGDKLKKFKIWQVAAGQMGVKRVEDIDPTNA
jgi:hypothetical protein